MAENIEFIESKRGGRLLCLNGFIYQKKRENDINIFWYCARRDKDGCRGAVKTLINLEGVVMTHDHNHAADERRVDVGKAHQQIRELATTGHDKPCQIRLNVLADMPAESREELGSLDSVRKIISRKRRNEYPPNVPVRELRLNGVWTQTIDNDPQNFMLGDNRDEHDRAIVFSSAECIRTLVQSNTWYMDGNFSIAPPGFMQLYIIRVPLGERAITVVYTLLQRKNQASYEYLLRTVSQAAIQMGLQAPAPQIVRCDFEMAVIQAVRQVLPQTNVSGCFYHLTQSTWRKIQDLGLVERYKQDDAVKDFTGMLDGLAFLPERDVRQGMTYLRNHTPQGMDELVDYFDTNYVSGVRRAQAQPGGRLVLAVAQPPIYPIPMWNVHEATAAGGDRTNNFCESWNVRVRALAGIRHPSVWKLLEVLKKEDLNVRTTIRLHQQGEVQRKRVRQETKRYNRRLINLVTDYRAGHRDLGDFLSAVGHNIRFGVERQQQ